MARANRQRAGVACTPKDPLRKANKQLNLRPRFVCGLGLLLEPIVDIFAGHVLCQVVAFLNFPLELVPLPVDLTQIVIGEFAHFSLTFRVSCFQFPSMRFQSIIASIIQ